MSEPLSTEELAWYRAATDDVWMVFPSAQVRPLLATIDALQAELARLTSEVSRLQRVADDAMARAEHFALHGDGPYRLCADCQDAAIARGKRTKRAAALAPQEAKG